MAQKRKAKKAGKLGKERSIFALRLDAALRSRHLTRRELSESTGINVGTINSWFIPGAGLPNMKPAIQVAMAIDVSLQYLGGLCDEEHDPGPVDDPSDALVDAVTRKLLTRLATPSSPATGRRTAARPR